MSFPNGIRAVLFDLDGTLADTAADLGLALNLLLTEYGKTSLPIAICRKHASSGARGLIQAGFGIAAEAPEYLKLKDRFLELYGNNICVKTKLFPGIPQLLDALEERSIPWGIVTNKAARFTTPLVSALGLATRACCVISGDTTPYSKPHPAPLLCAAELIRIEPEACLYIGDDLRDVQAARAAGMPVLAAGFGYLGDAGDPSGWGADAVIEKPTDILNFLDTSPSV